MSKVKVDQNLLFGLLALQTGMIDQGALFTAFNAWVREKARSMADVLFDQGVLDPGRRRLLEGLVAEHLKIHGGDLEQSLAAIDAGCSTRDRLAELGDFELAASVAKIGVNHDSPGSAGNRGPFDINGKHPEHGPATDGGGAELSSSLSMGTSSSAGLRFRVLRPHASGGLGAVYVALDTELPREVALKQILDRHADNPTSRRRFLTEAEITGGLEHPGIVPVYGLGSYTNGRPFYAMRFIRGESLKEAIAAFHADENLKSDSGRRSLEMRKLLRRFLDVCNAIEYAHSRGVLHRDLKPSNIIVGKHGETLVVDWGLAKALGRPDTDAAPEERTLMPSSGSGSAETLPGSALGTPAFMSPEQATGDLNRIGPRSDVYSLGATLYVLLTGRPAFKGLDVGAVLEAVRRGEFERPSTVDPSIDPALEAVCLKAMERSPEDRYASSRALADDVERFMADEPVSARTEPLSERSRRWARRHRSLVIAAAASLLVALAASVTIAVLQAVAARRERILAGKERVAKALAQARLDQVEKGNELLASVFKDLDPRAEEKEHKPLRAILGDRLSQAAASLEGEAVGDALTVAKLQDILGQSQANLGNTAEAITLVRRSYHTRETRLGPNHPETLSSRSSLFALYYAAGRAGEVIKLHEATLRSQEATLGRDHPETLRSRNHLAATYLTLGRPSEAESEFKAALAASEAALGADHTVSLESRNGLAEAYRALGRTTEAIQLHRETLEARQPKFGPDHPDTLISRDNLASTYWDAGQVDLAIAIFETSHKRLEAQLGPDHPDTLLSGHNLGVAYDQAGRSREAIALLEGTLKLMESKLAANHPHTLMCRLSLARAYRSADRLAEAIHVFEATLGVQQAKLGPDHPDVFRTRGTLAWTYHVAGRTADAIALFEPTLRAMDAKLGPDHGLTITCRYNLGGVYRTASRAAESMATLEAAYKVMVPKFGLDHPETLWVRASLAETWRVMGYVSEAIPMLDASLQAMEPKLRGDHPRRLEVRANLAAAYESLGQFAKMEPLVRSELERASRQYGRSDPRTVLAMTALGSCLVGLDQGTEAEPLLRECLLLREASEPDAWTTALTRSLLGAALSSQRRYAVAEPLIVSGYEGLKTSAAAIPVSRRRTCLSEAADRVVSLYEKFGKPDQAARWRLKTGMADLPPEVFARPKTVGFLPTGVAR
jgi:eukaryotic-like serine/threonine-protein kinase